MGYSEREGGSRYMSQVIIGEQGDILLNRRKVKPTHVERTVYGEGDGSDLREAIGADTVSPRPFEGVASLAFEFAILTAARSGEVFGGTSGRD